MSRWRRSTMSGSSGRRAGSIARSSAPIASQHSRFSSSRRSRSLRARSKASASRLPQRSASRSAASRWSPEKPCLGVPGPGSSGACIQACVAGPSLAMIADLRREQVPGRSSDREIDPGRLVALTILARGRAPQPPSPQLRRCQVPTRRRTRRTSSRRTARTTRTLLSSPPEARADGGRRPPADATGSSRSRR